MSVLFEILNAMTFFIQYQHDGLNILFPAYC